VGPFLDTYNHHHRHSGIGYHTPASVHLGTAALVRLERALVLDTAHAAHPERFVNGAPTPPQLPGPAWINKPKEIEAQDIA
jgi:putative transposase